MDRKEEIQYKNKMGLAAFLFFCGGMITGGMVERIDTQNKQKERMLEEQIAFYPYVEDEPYLYPVDIDTYHPINDEGYGEDLYPSRENSIYKVKQKIR